MSVPSTFHALQKEFHKFGEAEYHGGYMLYCNRVRGRGDYYEWCVMDPSGSVVKQDAYEGPIRGVCYDILNCATIHAMRGIGKNLSLSGRMNFGHWMSHCSKESFRHHHATQNFPLHDLEEIWNRYIAMTDEMIKAKNLRQTRASETMNKD